MSLTPHLLPTALIRDLVLSDPAAVLEGSTPTQQLPRCDLKPEEQLWGAQGGFTITTPRTSFARPEWPLPSDCHRAPPGDPHADNCSCKCCAKAAGGLFEITGCFSEPGPHLSWPELRGKEHSNCKFAWKKIYLMFFSANKVCKGLRFQ